ncbi:MAG: hypothetical protein IJT01_03015 [Selenomonadaceae bacterium]|nr:hypothetical protein [Selenomonadaceae bacterium]
MPEESRLELKVDELLRKQAETSERLAIVETLIKERTDDTKEVHDKLKSHEDRLSELESHKHSSIGAREVVAFLIMAGLALWGVLK